ncbi:fungal-specific transcription factor domain-containing protein [Hypoxylon trugodes]|uniref:fungal-specific transcription factor domain-containing protein n=1 Tax=Hypoxylon trugodes TaxID=326681 RepID=UPI002194C062|nr:fungal-specific transcription factor domain-containing protein [Hypoxylon trugodes]KAI1389445.1 fungal-specific transcription factor domain-containing protein [Hypoxylon trugodes]
MEQGSQIERRKACDVCYYKKIKCNMAKPTCSNCELYETPCKTSLYRRRGPAQPKAKAQTSNASVGDKSHSEANNSGASRNESLEERVAFLESRLAQLAQNASLAGQGHGSPPNSDGSWSGVIVGDATQKLTTSTSNSKAESAISILSDTNQSLVLPPLDDILPLVERFFEHTNAFIPLFEKSDFYRLLMDWYHPSGANSQSQAQSGSYNHIPANTCTRQTMFAAISVVIGLSYRVPSSATEVLEIGVEHPMVDRCMRNVEHVVMDLMNSAEDLVPLQVLLGLMMLYLGSRDSRPVTTLVGSAVQLCHRLRLHSSDDNAEFPAPLRIKRERLFWITYILDKEISMRYQTPPLLSDDDTDVELSSELEGSQNDVFAEVSRGMVPFGFFHHRVQLAGIQGLIYQQLYSSSAGPSKLPLEQRRARIFLLDAHLENWRQKIPPEFQLQNLIRSLFPDGFAAEKSDKRMGAFIHMVELHFTHIGALVRMHGVWSRDAGWLKLISEFSKQAVRDCAEGGSKCGAQIPPYPKQWERCVKASRDCLQLVQNMPLTISNIWSTGCAYVSSLVIVLVNQLQSNDIDQLEADQVLIREGLSIFVKIKEVSTWYPLHRLHSVLLGLEERATREILMKRLQGPDATAATPVDVDAIRAMATDIPMSQHFTPGDWSMAMN